MPESVPKRPDTAERAAPEAGRGGVGDLAGPWLDELDPLGRDPRQWRADPGGVAAAQGALRDPHARAVLDQRLDAGVAAPLEVEPGGPARRDRLAADDLREQLSALEIDRVCRELLHAAWFGYAVAEAIWEIDGPRVRLADLRTRDPARFRWRADATLLLATRERPRGAELPPAKFVALRQPRQHGGQPHGPGCAYWCRWPVWLKRQALRMWAVSLEKFGAPTAVGRVRRDADPREIERLLETQQAMAAGVGVVLPEGQDLELLDTARRSGGDYAAFVGAMDSMVADAVLGQRATSEIGPWRGTAEVQAAVLDRLVAADARRLNAALRQSVAAWLAEWNHPGAAAPVLSRDLAPPEDLLARARRDEIVARTAGLRPTAADVRRVYGGEWESAPAARFAARDGPFDPPPASERDAGGDQSAFAADGDDPVPALAARTRDALGPLIDQWAEGVRRGIADAGSLAEARARLDALLAWTASPSAPVPDVADAAAALAEALAAAHLAGRFDVGDGADEGELAFASAAAHARLPFAEQIDFFRSKLDLPTESWTDIWQEQHDRAFVVAGAARADLVADLRSAVDRAVADGGTLEEFRRDFDAVVAKHGWSYKGGRDWRAETIYGTNLRTSYAAGRRRQMKEIADRRPYWRYRHSRASENPRHEHQAWDGLVLRHDDPWWDAHYPPNGWGCRCFVETLGERDLERLGKAGPDQAPAVETRTATVGARGPSPRTVEVPEGIDPGWAYAPGASALRASAADPRALPELSRADATARQLGPQRGSSPGGLFEGADGRARYVKFYDDPAQSYCEAVANRAYRELGLDAPASALVRERGRIVGVANGMVDHDGALGRAGRVPKGRAREILKGYAADVWLANWDAVGLDLDNVVRARARRDAVARVDQGGALLVRARAGRKPAGALETVSEWDGFADPRVNPAYAKVLRAAGLGSADELGDAALRRIAAIRALGRRTNGFRDLAPDARGVPAADRDAVRRMLARRAELLENEIVPRVRRAMAAARGMPRHHIDLKRDMGTRYARYLASAMSMVAAGFDKRGMTDPELAAGYAYTTSDRPWGYLLLNEALRDAERPGGPPLPKRYDDYRRTLDDALDRLPDHSAGGLKRGTTLTPNEIAGYVPGSVVTEAAFTSASVGRGFGGNVRFTIRSLHGKRIDGLSRYPSEREVLFRAGTRFRVLDKYEEGSTTYIELEEVDDD